MISTGEVELLEEMLQRRRATKYRTVICDTNRFAALLESYKEVRAQLCAHVEPVQVICIDTKAQTVRRRRRTNTNSNEAKP